MIGLLQWYVLALWGAATQCSFYGEASRIDSEEEPFASESTNASSTFECPVECQECCMSSKTWSAPWSANKTLFKCVLKMPFGEATAPEGRSCRQVKRRTKKGQMDQATVECEFLPGEKGDKTSELAAKCSVKSRCCCDALGTGMCIGDHPHEARLRRLYNLGSQTVTEAFPFTDGALPMLNSWGTCPIGFSDWSDGVNTPCHCDTACGDSTKADWPPEPRAPEESHRWKQMVGLAAAVYVGEPQVSGWKLEKFWDVAENWKSATDYVAIYRREVAGEKQCTLSIAGTDDTMNIGADILGWMRYASKWCGFPGVHASFSNYLRAFMNGRRFPEFDRFLSDPKECERVIVVGHSLGGSMAELLAGCANRPDSEAVISKKVKQIHFKVHELYTYGAAGISTTMITNHIEGHPDHCFEGARFYLEKTVLSNASTVGMVSHYVDPIPNIGSFRPVPLTHPKIDVVAIEEVHGGDPKRIVRYRSVAHCDTSYADSRGTMATWQKLQAPWGVSAGIHNYLIHNTKVYYDSLANIPDLN